MNGSIIERVLNHAKLRPNAPAIYWQQDKISYYQLAQKILTLAEHFRRIPQPGPVAVHLSRTPDLIAALLAVWHSGRAFVALDARHPEARRQSIIVESAPAAIVYDTQPPTATDCQLWHISELTENNAAMADMLPQQHSSDTAYLLYTSGSTGKPKGIAIGHPSVDALTDWALAFYSPKQLKCVLASTTITFDLAIFEIFVPLAAGTSLYLVDSALDLLTPSSSYAVLTLINTVPSAARELVRAQAIPQGVTTVNLAGEALHWKLVNDIYQCSQVSCICNLWGPSEDTTYSTVYRSLREEERPESGPVPIGRVIEGSQAFILNDALQLVEFGEPGEICLAGNGLAEGYHNNPSLTAERFPFIRGQEGQLLRIYRTGDWGHQDRSGILHFHGRMDFQVKICGYRIELEELEQSLLTLNEVREAAIIVDNTHQEQQKLIAVVVKSDINEPDGDFTARCLSRLQAMLPPYMMPHVWHIRSVVLPRTTSGKICRRTLSEEWSQTLSLSSEPPLSPVIQLMSEALGSVPDEDAAFMAQGGDSLSAVRFQTLLRTQLGKLVSLDTLLSQNVTLRDLEQQIQRMPVSVGAVSAPLTLEADRLSAIEYRMFKVYQTHRARACYNIGVTLCFDEGVDVPRLKQSFLTVLHRSRALSCCIEPDEQGACYRPACLDDVWRQECGTGTDGELSAFYAIPFQLESEPPVRALLLNNGHAVGSTLLLSIAHTAVDGLGLRALLQNIASLYRDERHSAPATYVITDVITEPDEARRRAAQSYWQDVLNGFQSKPVWPQALCNVPDGSLSWTFSREVHQELVDKGREKGVTLPVLLMTTLFIALQRLSGNQDIVIATPVANRQQSELQRCVANMTNTLPLRCQLNDESNAGDVLRKIQKQLSDSLAWQDVAIDGIMADLEGVADKDAMFSTLFSYMDFLQGMGTSFDLSVRCDFYQPQEAKAPLVVSAIVTEEGDLRVIFEYQGDTVYPEWVSTLSQLFKQLLCQGCAMEDTVLRQINPVPLAQQPLLQALQESSPVATATSLVSWLATSAEIFSSRIAVQDDDTAITYARLWQETESLAAGLQASGVKPGDAVGVSMEKGWRLIAVLCAVLRTGAFYVPLDPRNPSARNHYIAQQSKVCLTVVDDSVIPASKDIHYSVLLRPNQSMTPVSVSGDDLAYVIFTSGTTGQPKGVTVTHHNVCRLFSACQQWANFGEQDSWTLFHSFAFDFSVWEIFGALLYGGRLVIVPPALATDMVGFASLLDQHCITVLSLTPTAFRNFIGTTGTTLNHRPRMIIFGGEALRPADLNPWWQCYGSEQTRLINMYGITEITVHATVHEMSPDDTMSCIGKPLADNGIVLRDKRGLLCPVGVPGELCISGDGVSLGYLNSPALNQQRFGTLVSQTNRYYFSGDLAVADGNGQLYYLGRLDKQVKINGHRVELDEISVTLRQIPGIKACVVRAIHIGGGTRMLAAWYVAEQDITPQTVTKRLSQSLPVWAIPEKLMRIAALPLTVNGKIDESQLPDPLTDTGLSQQHPTQPVQYIWQQILGHESLPDDLPFFEAGGSSIKAALLVQQLNKLLEQPVITLLDIFRHPCIRDQQRLVDQFFEEETI
ncbi:amino acid adenylation protein [Pectobacterium parvum]|uniref:non-ribosomal peptide synthetase n=1 Tax=Pectobacterium parvum TaxID=2778550 RepID=UPI0005055C11|nr:non-ribosomal peptide synthetase [Pectobacterium parvum]KFX15348.1 amino acid adenylation protein [Pectobacterium parvum]